MRGGRDWGSPHTCLFLSTTKRRGTLLYGKGKLGHLHVDVMMAAKKKRAVLYGFCWVDIAKERHLCSLGCI